MSALPAGKEVKQVELLVCTGRGKQGEYVALLMRLEEIGKSDSGESLYMLYTRGQSGQWSNVGTHLSSFTTVGDPY